MLNRLYISLLLFTSFLFVSFDASAIVVKKVRLGQHGEMTRVVLESDQVIKPEYFSLQTPPRFVLDFKKSDFKVEVGHLKLPAGGIIEGVRQGLFKPGVTRMVVDLDRAVNASVFNIPASKGKGHRLVIDLKPATKAQIAKQKAKLKSLQAQKRSKPRAVEIFERVKKKSNEVVVVLDPGHGGVDPGAVGRNRTYEKHVVLQIAKKLKTELEKTKGVRVYLTRSKDIFVPLKDRVAFAQRKNADMFVSIHADAHSDRRIKGGSVYALSDSASDKEAHRLARNANKGDLIAGMDMREESKNVKSILIDLTQRETMNKSAILAADILGVMRDKVSVRKEKVAFAGFRVLKAPEIPSVLVEVTYLSNVREERKLKQRDHQQLLAKSIAKGVNKYIKKHRLN
ncbi:MAG: N-acetylmuramoyl-L-alanine amidase [Alphaproteobacteria bacterium]|jgi:N-acetylmuramoyl-L-alanine amidase